VVVSGRRASTPCATRERYANDNAATVTIAAATPRPVDLVRVMIIGLAEVPNESARRMIHVLRASLSLALNTMV